MLFNWSLLFQLAKRAEQSMNKQHRGQWQHPPRGENDRIFLSQQE